MPTPQNVGIINFANVITHFHDLTLYYKKFSPKTLTLKNEISEKNKKEITSNQSVIVFYKG